MLSDIVSEGMNQREEPLVALSAFFLMRFLQERVPFVGVDVTIAISIKLIENLVFTIVGPHKLFPAH